MVASFRIRKARQRDVRSIARLWRELYGFHAELDPFYTCPDDASSGATDFISGMIASREGLVLVATAERRIVGYLLAGLRRHPPVFAISRYGSKRPANPPVQPAEPVVE